MIARRRLAAAVVVAAAVGTGGWLLYRHFHAAPEGSTMVFYGDVDIREVRPAFNDSGAVTAMQVVEGSVVKKGELLATLDDTRYAARLAQARAQARSLKATLKKLLDGSRPEEIVQARATMTALRAIYEKNKVVYARTLRLLPHGIASVEDRDNARAQLDSSRNDFEAARQTYILAVKGPRIEDIDAARTAYQAAVANVALAAREYADTRLYAAADGVVEDRILEPGDMASPATPVYTIALTQPLWVRAYVPEDQLGKVRLGMAASVTTDSYPGHVYRGWIGYLSPTSEFTPKTVETPELRTALVYQLRVYVCNTRDELRLGMPATVHVDLNQAPTAPGCGPADASRP